MTKSMEQAQVLFKEGAIFLFLDVPEGTEFGIDYNTWTVGSQFKGVKMIPPGIHFVYFRMVAEDLRILKKMGFPVSKCLYCSACNKEGQASPRTGFFHNFRRQEILVRKWDKINEDILDEEVSEDEIQHYQDNREDLDRFLGPYPYDSYKKWISLSDHMTDTLISRLQPENKKIASVSEFISERSTSTSRREARRDKGENSDKLSDTEPSSIKEAQAKLPAMKVRPGSVLRFSDIPKQKYPAGSCASDITKYSMDSSYALERFLENYCSEEQKDILGEIQFSFICFLIGQVLDAFDQWKKLVHLVCSSEEALQKHPALFMDFITMMHFQVKEIPEDFFVDIVSQNNFLTTTLQEFFSNLDNSSVDECLRHKGLKFRDHLTVKFKWDFTSDPDDYAPVVVKLDD